MLKSILYNFGAWWAEDTASPTPAFRAGLVGTARVLTTAMPLTVPAQGLGSFIPRTVGTVAFTEQKATEWK